MPEDRKGAGLVLSLTVGDNLALSALDRLSRRGLVDSARADQRALARVRDMSIKAPGLGAEVATLSGGNQQKIAIGKWLERAPRVLLLDEPTRGVDVGAKAEIYALIDDLTARGHAVVLASSDLPEVVRLADRVLVLREGKLAGELAADAITQLAIMQLAVGALCPPSDEPVPTGGEERGRPPSDEPVPTGGDERGRPPSDEPVPTGGEERGRPPSDEPVPTGGEERGR